MAMVTVAGRDPTEMDPAGAAGFSYDPSTLAQFSDGRWYARDTNGTLQLVAASADMGRSMGLQQGPNAAATLQQASTQKSQQGGAWNPIGDFAKVLGPMAAAAFGGNAIAGMLGAGTGTGAAIGAANTGGDMMWPAGAGMDTAAGAGAAGAGAISPIAGSGGAGAGMGAAGAAASGLAGAAGAAGGLPSWLSALGPGLGIASGLNTLLSTPSNTGPGSGGLPSVGQSSATVGPGNLAAYQKLLGIDPSGMVAAGNQAGTQYADLAKQMQQYQAMMEAQAANAGGAQTDLQAQGQKEFGAGNAMQTAGLGIMGNAQPLITAGNAAWNTAQDPQSALYARTAQQLQDQSRAATSARGIGMSPEAAGIEGGTMSNFNIDWQNQQLQRLLSGLSGMGGAYNAAANQYGAGSQAFGQGTGAVNAGTGAYNAAGNQGRLYGADTAAAAGFGAAVPGYTQQSGAVPFQTQQAAYGAPLQAGVDYATATNTAFNPQLANYANTQQQFGANQSAAGMNALLTGIYGYNPNSPFASMGAGGNTPGSWLQTAFGTPTDTSGQTGGQPGGTGLTAPGSYMSFPAY